MINPVQTNQLIVYELTKEDIEDIILGPLTTQLRKPLPFVPNKISVDYSDPGNGIYQVRLEFDETLPQVMPIREVQAS